MKVKVINTDSLDKETIDKIENPMKFNRWYYENDTKFAEIENSKGDIIRIFPERIKPIKATMKNKSEHYISIDLDQRYMSTYHFVGYNELSNVANMLWGKGWIAEDDLSQIQELLDHVHENMYTVHLIAGLRDDYDIEVRLNERVVDNSDFISVICHLANRVTEAKFGHMTYADNDSDTLEYTEDAQDFFDRQYDEIEHEIIHRLNVQPLQL